MNMRLWSKFETDTGGGGRGREREVTRSYQRFQEEEERRQGAG